MLIDTHVHLLPDDVADDGKRLMRELAEAGIDLAIVSDLGDWSAEPSSAVLFAANHRMRELAAIHAPRLAYLVYLNPLLPDWRELLETHRETALGIKLWISCRDASGSLAPTHAVLEAAEQEGLPVLLHVLHHTGRTEKTGELDLDDFLGLAQAHPQCTMICAHCGGNYELAAQKLAGLPANKYVDVSGTFPFWNMTAAMLQALGRDRVLFGSDGPGRSFSSQRAKVDYAGIAPEDAEAVLAGNAIRLYHLEDTVRQLKPRAAASYPPLATKEQLPAWGEDHFCFVGGSGYNRVTAADLNAMLERNHVERGYAADLDADGSAPLEQAQRLLAACAAYPRIVPLAAVDPRSPRAMPALIELQNLVQGIWVSPYYHGFMLNEPLLEPFWQCCADLQLPIWLNCELADARFRPESLRTAHAVTAPELRQFIAAAPANSYVVQAAPDLVHQIAGSGRWRFELSRLSDSERSFAKFAQRGATAPELCWGSEYPFRASLEVFDVTTGGGTLYAE